MEPPIELCVAECPTNMTSKTACQSNKENLFSNSDVMEGITYDYCEKIEKLVEECQLDV